MNRNTNKTKKNRMKKEMMSKKEINNKRMNKMKNNLRLKWHNFKKMKKKDIKQD